MLVPVITDFTCWLLLNYKRALDPFRWNRGEMAMSPPRRACLFFLHGRCLQFSESFRNLLNADVCVFQRSALVGMTLRPRGSDNTCRSFGSASAHVTGGRSGGIVGMLGPLC